LTLQVWGFQCTGEPRADVHHSPDQEVRAARRQGVRRRHAQGHVEEPQHHPSRRQAARGPAPAQPAAAQPPLPIPTPRACTILNLTRGPINLNLLGPRVATNEIRLLVEAIPGAGNLLGNLLCAIANLLNPSPNTPLAQLAQVLNALLALAPRTAAPPA